MTRSVFQAIADPTRREIIDLLSLRPQNLNDLVGNFSITRPGVAKHVKILSDSGLVRVEKSGRERICHVQLHNLGEIALWVHKYRRFWNDSLDQLEELLRKESQTNKNKKT